MLDYKWLPLPPYSLDLAPSVYFLVSSPTKKLCVTKTSTLGISTNYIIQKGLKKLWKCWSKIVELGRTKKADECLKILSLQHVFEHPLTTEILQSASYRACCFANQPASPCSIWNEVQKNVEILLSPKQLQNLYKN